MPALTAANVVVTLNLEDIDRSPDGRIGIRTFPAVAFGNGVLTYPALGIPMPAIGKFGFHFAIKRVYIENPGNGYIYSFDRTNHKVRIWLGAARDAITVANHVGVAPTGNLANLVAAAHSHDLVIAGNGSHTFDAGIGVVEANSALASNVANAVTVPGGIAANGGIANTTPGNSSGDFVGDAPANLTHTVTGGGAVAEAALAEMDDTVAPAATTLNMEMVGR